MPRRASTVRTRPDCVCIKAFDVDTRRYLVRHRIYPRTHHDNLVNHSPTVRLVCRFHADLQPIPLALSTSDVPQLPAMGCIAVRGWATLQLHCRANDVCECPGPCCRIDAPLLRLSSVTESFQWSSVLQIKFSSTEKLHQGFVVWSVG
jgi:hypothetical protein